MYGHLAVERVAGNFHVSVHGQSYLVLQQVFSSVGDVNVSHIIHSLGFGVPYPGRLNPLDGFVRILPPLKEGEDPARSSGTFKYFLKVVPTRFRFWHGGTVKTNQYSISEYFTPSSPQSNALPAVYFLYDLSPIAVSITESHRSFFHFLTRLCAVLGGTFALSGMLDRWVYSLLQLVNRPHHAYAGATSTAPTLQTQGSTKDIDEKRSTRDKGRGGSSRRRECRICHDPAHLSYECPERDENDEDDHKGGRGRSTSRHLRRDKKPRKEKQTPKNSSSTKDVDSSSGKGRGDEEASCSMVGVVELTVSLAPEAGEDFYAVAAAVQANPMAVLLNSGCSHHLIETKAVLVDMAPSDGVKHSSSTEEVALRTIVSATKSTPDWLHARLAHVGIDTIKSSAKHEVATGLNIKLSTEADPPCVSSVGGKLAQHSFPDKGSDAEEELAVLHIDLCGPFRVAAKDGSLYFLLPKDCHTRFVWVMPVVKKSNVLWEFQKWLVLVERQAKKSVLMLRSDWGGEFLGKEFTDFVDGKGIVHDLTCPYTPQQNDMAEREMRTAVEFERMMLLHMGVQHLWWNLALRQSIWVRNYLERSTTPLGTTPFQLLTGKKPDLTLARVWGCMVKFMVPVQQRGGKLAPKARWGLHLGVSPESKGWEVLDLTDIRVVTSFEVIFYETLSLEVWKAEYGSASRRTQAHPLTGTSTATVPLLAEWHRRWLIRCQARHQGREVVDDRGAADKGASRTGGSSRSAATGEQQTGQSIGEQPVEHPTLARQLVDDEDVDEEGEQSVGEESTDSDEVEVPIKKPELRHTGRTRKPLDFFVPAAINTAYNEKGEAVKAAMDEEICSPIGMGTWELVERPRRVNIMKNRWVLTTKYRIDDTVKRKKARLVVKGFTQVCGADYDETYSPVSSYVMLRIFLSIVAVLDLNLMQLDMKNAFLQMLVYVDDLLAASSSTAMLKELKELLEAAFEQREISPVVKYLGLEIVRDRLAKKLWLHQQNYANKLRRRLIDEEQGSRVPKTPVSVDAYAELMFDDEEAQECEEKEYRQKVGSLQFAATMTRPEIAFACSKLGSGLTQLDDGKRTVLRADNKSAITVAEGLGLTGNLKHMEQRYAWLQHMVRHGKFVLKYIPTTEQPAEFMPKGAAFSGFQPVLSRHRPSSSG
ncbi:unnamed protein product [Closterium sp. NIES-53]